MAPSKKSYFPLIFRSHLITEKVPNLTVSDILLISQGLTKYGFREIILYSLNKVSGGQKKPATFETIFSALRLERPYSFPG